MKKFLYVIFIFFPLFSIANQELKIFQNETKLNTLKLNDYTIPKEVKAISEQRKLEDNIINSITVIANKTNEWPMCIFSYEFGHKNIPNLVLINNVKNDTLWKMGETGFYVDSDKMGENTITLT